MNIEKYYTHDFHLTKFQRGLLPKGWQDIVKGLQSQENYAISFKNLKILNEFKSKDQTRQNMLNVYCDAKQGKAFSTDGSVLVIFPYDGEDTIVYNDNLLSFELFKGIEILDLRTVKSCDFKQVLDFDLLANVKRIEENKEYIGKKKGVCQYKDNNFLVYSFDGVTEIGFSENYIKKIIKHFGAKAKSVFYAGSTNIIKIEFDYDTWVYLCPLML